MAAGLTSDLDDNETNSLEKMHIAFSENHKEWNDRIEICYLSVPALQKIKTYLGISANISPGEPFRVTKVEKHWLIDIYTIREHGVVVYGPDPKIFIEPISKDEFIEVMKDYIKSWDSRLDDLGKNQRAQAYAILSMCRAFYAIKLGEQASKKHAALWTQTELPEWHDLIDKALMWREIAKEEDVTDEINYSKTIDFVNFMRNKLLS